MDQDSPGYEDTDDASSDTNQDDLPHPNHHGRSDDDNSECLDDEYDYQSTPNNPPYQCLGNANEKRVSRQRRPNNPPLLTTSNAIKMTSTPPAAAVLPSVIVICLSLITFVIPVVTSEGFCDPRLCACEANAANCSSRSFLTLPTGLPRTVVR